MNLSANLKHGIDLSEIPFYMEQLEQAKLVQDDVDVSQQEKRLKQVELVEAAIERIDAALGGQKYEGKAMTPSGKLEAGTFLSLGPTSLFCFTGLANPPASSKEKPIIPMQLWHRALLRNKSKQYKQSLKTALANYH
jgi:hypothetical protein